MKVGPFTRTLLSETKERLEDGAIIVKSCYQLEHAHGSQGGCAENSSLSAQLHANVQNDDRMPEDITPLGSTMTSQIEQWSLRYVSGEELTALAEEQHLTVDLIQQTGSGSALHCLRHAHVSS